MKKLKKIWQNKNRKIENLIVFLIILVITLVIINTIIKEEPKKENKHYTNAELASTSSTQTEDTNIESRLETILSQMDGIGEVRVLVTYSQSSSIIPLYNETSSKSVTEETDTSGGTRTIEAQDNEKSVVTGSDSNPVTEKTIHPKMEGAIVTAQGANNATVKANIIAAVEAVTGLATHKIQVFEMKNK